MGQLLDKLVDVSGTYRECQAAALGKAKAVPAIKASGSGPLQP